MPPVPPLMTANVAVDARGTAWVSRPWGLEAMAMEPLGGTNPGTTPPANPRIGDQWWDTGVNELKVWNGTTWTAASGGGSAGIGEPTTAGSFLRTNTGAWVGGLPLTSTVTATVPGVVMTVNDSSWANYGIGMTVVDGQGIRVENQGAGEGIYLRNQATATNRLLYLTDVRTAAMTDFLGTTSSFFLNRAAATNSNPILHINQGTAPGPAINVNHNTPISGTYAASFRTDRTTTGTAGSLLGNLVFAGRNVTGNTNPGVTGAEIRALSTAPWSATAAGTRLEFLTAPATAPITPVVRMTIDQNGNLILPGLPTADPGISGAVWNNGGVLNISP